LEYFISNKSIRSARALFFFSLLVVAACNPTKYVPQGDTLYDRTYIKVDGGDIGKGDLAPYIRQKPNKRIFGARFHLGLYNWSNLDKDNWFHRWLRNIGEEPVVFDPAATNRSKQQLTEYLRSKGYFDARVDETIEIAKRKSKVFYNIDLAAPYTIRNLKYEVDDPDLQKYIYFDSLACLVQRNERYDFDKLTAERARLERLIRDLGFYSFSIDNIRFRINDTIGNNEVDIAYIVRNQQVAGPGGTITMMPPDRFKVGSIYIFPEYDPGKVLSVGSDAYISDLDTISHNDFHFIGPSGKPRVRHDLIMQSLFITPGSLYSATRTESSHKRLSSLKSYRLINIGYREQEGTPADSLGRKSLDAVIQLTPFNQQSFTYLLEGTNSGGNYGAAMNLIYQHKNLFNGARQFNLTFKGAYERLSEEVTGFRSTQELGAEASIQFPEFLVPFLKKENFIRKYNPRSFLQLAYNYQKIPVYTRTVANASFGYNWNQDLFKSHMLYPFRMNLVKLPYIDPDFAVRIDTSSYLSFSYKDVLIMGGSYTFTFNNQVIQKSSDNIFFKINLETAGNLLALGSRLSGAEKSDDTYQLFGQQYAQFFKTDIDYRYNWIMNDVSAIVYRAFIGAGIPYGNSKALPFEKQYFGGGSNGVRAWQVRSLGPGSFLNDIPSFVNQTADIKLEFNAEYRFKLFWILEGAVFADAGNIWTIRDDPDRPGAVFRFNKFIDDMAVGTGLGMRFDLKFVLLRADMGIKLRDPAIQDTPKWIRLRRPYNFREDFTFVLGIGYPF